VLGASDPGRLTPYGYDREIMGPDGSVLYRIRFCAGPDQVIMILMKPILSRLYDVVYGCGLKM